jgi:hypothetical protein
MSKKATTTEELAVRVLKTGTCPTLSGKSTLTYKVGCTEALAIMLRITGNTNPGYFNSEWVPYADVQALLAKQDQGKAITSFTLVPLYRGKSTNSPSFLFAVLKQEGLVKLSESKKRCYDRCDDAAFLASIKKLIDGKPVVEQAPKAKAGKNNKAQVASEPVEKPLIVLGDVPDNKPAKRGRPKKTEQVVDAVVPEANQPETA